MQVIASIWSTPWCSLWDSIHDHMHLPVTTLPLPATVSELWVPNSRSWNVNLIASIFDNQAVQEITNINPVNSDQQDILRWIPSKNGQCSTKNIYRHISSQSVIQLKNQGSRSIQPQANQILQRDWKSKELSPLIKAFTWRLIRRTLATAERAARYSTNSDKQCAACGAVEDNAHHFSHCHLPRAVWFSSNPPLQTDNLPQENDGVQLTLHAFISNLTPNAVFHKILITLWYLWKARNDTRFQRKTWTPWQVHHAVAAHISTQQAGIDTQPQLTVPPLTDLVNRERPLSATTTASRPTPTPDNNYRMLGMIFPSAPRNQEGDTIQGRSNPQMNRFILHMPAIVPGIRCYVVASTTPNLPSLPSRMAGLGIFFVNTQIQPAQTIYIKAHMSRVQSMIMAEAAALAIAAMVNHSLNFNNTVFLSDCQ